MSENRPHMAYPLGVAQWRILNLLLQDGGALSTRDITEALFPGRSKDHVGNTLRSLERRGLLTKEIVAGRSTDPRARTQHARKHHRHFKEALWSIRVAREPGGWQVE